MPATGLEHSVREAAAAFVRHIGNLSHEPEVRDALLKTAVHEVTRQLLDEFGDHCRLAEQLEIMSRLAWAGSAAFEAAGIAGRASLVPSEQHSGGSHLENDRTVRPPSGTPAFPTRSRQLANAALAELEC